MSARECVAHDLFISFLDLFLPPSLSLSRHWTSRRRRRRRVPRRSSMAC